MRLRQNSTMFLSLIFLTFLASSSKAQDNAFQDTVAFIIGGFDESYNNIFDTVELFGCPNSNGSLYPSPYPYLNYLTSGAFIHDDQDGHVLACGGVECTTTPTCYIQSKCYEWRPSTNEWTPAPSLGQTRYAAIMATSIDEDDRIVPTMIGFRDNNESLNPVGNYWEPNGSVPTGNWNVISTLCQYRDKIYHIERDQNSTSTIYQLDIDDWSVEVIGFLDQGQGSPVRCTENTINGSPGIMTGGGFWFNLETRVAIQVAWYEPEAMFSIGGRPTAFAGLSCVENPVECGQVVQYEADRDEWVKIGELGVARHYHEVVEVPKEFCNFVSR